MRIVFQFYSKQPCCSGSGDPYATKITERPPKKMRGFQVELLAVDATPEGEERDALYIEGDGAAVKAMLRSMLHIVSSIEQSCQRQYAKERAKTKKCRGCGAWVAHKHSCSRLRAVVERSKKIAVGPTATE